jgi:hypothetical protein
MHIYILSHVWVTIDGVWIGDSIYWPLIDSNYGSIANLPTLHITRAHAKTSQSALTCRFLITDLNDKDSSASVLMSLPAGQYSTDSLSKWKSKLCYDRRFSRPVRLGIKHQSGVYDQIFITVRQLQACWCGALSLTRARIVLLIIYRHRPHRKHRCSVVFQLLQFSCFLLRISCIATGNISLFVFSAVT